MYKQLVNTLQADTIYLDKILTITHEHGIISQQNDELLIQLRAHVMHA